MWTLGLQLKANSHVDGGLYVINQKAFTKFIKTFGLYLYLCVCSGVVKTEGGNEHCLIHVFLISEHWRKVYY